MSEYEQKMEQIEQLQQVIDQEKCQIVLPNNNLEGMFEKFQTDLSTFKSKFTSQLEKKFSAIEDQIEQKVGQPMNRKDESEENLSWAKKVLKNMERTNMLIAPSVRTAQSAEIKDEKAFSCVLSNFNCDESKMDLKSFFVKHCLEVPGIQLQISKENISYIKKN